MAPLDGDRLPGVQNLLRKPHRAEPVAIPLASDFDPLPVDDDPGPARREPAVADASPLSPRGQARWRCIEALSAFSRSGLDTGGRWQMVAGWGSSLPLGQLDATDRYRFTAWLIRRLDEAEPAQVIPLARWLFDRGVSDTDRLNRWADELDGLTDVPNDLRIVRMALVGELRAELQSLSRKTGSAGASSGV
jgi:hypothetical protein